MDVQIDVCCFEMMRKDCGISCCFRALMVVDDAVGVRVCGRASVEVR